MNTIQKLRVLGLSILLITGISTHEKLIAQPGVSISFQTFYNELSPYGRWTNSPQYGSVWTPYADAGFQPYSTSGYWEVTEYGNTWVSDYDWGWAPFHYGRWSYDDYNGWFWIPGYEWGPAWVNWRSGGDYYGWAPLGPGMNINISVNIPSFWWVFVPQRYIASRSWYNYCAPRQRIGYIYNQTTIINNYYRSDNRVYAYGPRREDIERVTRRSVPVRQIDVSQRGRVITDRSYGRNDRYEAPDRNSPVYQSNRRPSTIDANTIPGRDNSARTRPDNRSDNGRYSAPSADSRDRSYPSNGRVDSPNDNSGYNRPNRERGSAPDLNADRNSNRSYEPARPNNNPGVEQKRESSSPSNGSDRGGRSDRSSDGGDYSRGRSESPVIRSAPTERNSTPRESPRSESRSNSSERGSRSSRSPR